MASQTYALVNLFRRLTNVANDALDNVSIEDDEKEPGQQSGTGNVALSQMTLNDARERSQTNLCIIDGAYFQQNLNDINAVLLDIYRSNGLYMCDRSEMEANIRTHMAHTGAYAFIGEVNDGNPKCVRQQLDSIVEHVNTLLNDLLGRQCITESHFYQMTVERSMVRMDYGCFLPDPSSEGVPFRPFMVHCLGPLVGIARFVSRLVQPVYDEMARSTTFFNASDAVHAVELYAEQDRLKPTTLFVTLYVNDLCTLLPHEETIQVLERFLNERVSNGHLHGLSIQTIIELVRFVVTNQVFLFRKRMYRQIKGGTANSPLTDLLANIYMFYWQADLVKVLADKNEVFGRCLDEAVLTWNGSKSALCSLLKTTMSHPTQSMPITVTIGQKISYLNVQIAHVHGKLSTKIDHEMDDGPSPLPYLIDHPPHMHSTLLRASLIRAVLCCATLSDFQAEHLDIEDTFFSNGFSSDHITSKVDGFFEEFNASALKSNATSHEEYLIIRRRLFDYEQYQRAMQLQQRVEEQHQQIGYIPSPLHGDDLCQLKEDVQRLWQNYRIKETQLHDVNIEVVGHPKYPIYTK